MLANQLHVVVAAFLSGLGAVTSGCAAQSPSPAEHHSAVSLPRATRTGSSQDEIVSVRQLWTEYLASKHGKLASNAGTPSPLWLASEQVRWPMYDLAGFYVPDGAVPQSVRIQPARAGGAHAYEIVTRFSPAGSKSADSGSAVVLTMTVYGVRDKGQWVLANTLPRKTAAWRREDVGQITYLVEPGLAFNRQKAQRAAAFVDSLATAFAVPPHRSARLLRDFERRCGAEHPWRGIPRRRCGAEHPWRGIPREVWANRRVLQAGEPATV